MEREPNEPNSNSTRIIFRTYLILIGIDLFIAILWITLASLNNPASPQDIRIGFAFILLIIAAGQLLIILPAAIILLILRKWEIAVGLLLADITLFFLCYLVCTV